MITGLVTRSVLPLLSTCTVVPLVCQSERTSTVRTQNGLAGGARVDTLVTLSEVGDEVARPMLCSHLHVILIL